MLEVSKFAILSLVPACQPFFPLFEICCLISTVAHFHNIPQFLSLKAKNPSTNRISPAECCHFPPCQAGAAPAPARCVGPACPGCPVPHSFTRPEQPELGSSHGELLYQQDNVFGGSRVAVGSPLTSLCGQSCGRGWSFPRWDRAGSKTRCSVQSWVRSCCLLTHMGQKQRSCR